MFDVDADSPSNNSVKSPQDSQRNSISVLISRQSRERRREHDLQQEQRVADVAGQQVCDPAPALLVFRALV